MNKGVIGPCKQPDTNVRVVFLKPLNASRQVIGHQVGVRADHEGGPPLGIIHLSLKGVNGGDHRCHQIQKSSSLRGKSHGTLDALEKCDSELILQFTQVGSDRRLSQFQLTGRFSDAS